MQTVHAWIDDIVSKHFVPSIVLPAKPPLPGRSSLRDSLDILRASDEAFIASLQQSLLDTTSSHHAPGLPFMSPSHGGPPPPGGKSKFGRQGSLTVDRNALSTSVSRSGAAPLPSIALPSPVSAGGHTRTSLDGLRKSFTRDLGRALGNA
jgi:hypothetical protein